MFDLFQYGFMVRALIAGSLIGVVCPALGTFLVLRRLSLIADTLAHVALAGAAVGIVFHTSPSVVAVVASASAAVTIEWLRSSGRLFGESALALFLYAALAVAVVLISLAQSFNASLLSLLFGSILTVSEEDLWLIGGMAVLALGVVVVFYQEFVQIAFDPDLARVSGVAVGPMNFLLALLAGVIVALGMRIVGVLLVGALIVIPVTASLQVSRGFRTTLLLAVAFGLLSVVGGLVSAFMWNIAAGGAVVLAALAILAITAALHTVQTAFRRSRALGEGAQP